MQLQIETFQTIHHAVRDTDNWKFRFVTMKNGETTVYRWTRDRPMIPPEMFQIASVKGQLGWYHLMDKDIDVQGPHKFPSLSAAMVWVEQH